MMFKVIRTAFSFLWRWLRSGRRKNHDGYVVIRSMSGREQLEHRAIAERVLGRRLVRGEVIHHMNGRRDDNRKENLCLMLHHEHVRYHEWYKWVVKTYRRYPRRDTQLRKLRESFKGTPLSDVKRA